MPARNAVTAAMKELEEGAGVRWGSNLPSTEKPSILIERERREEPSFCSFSKRPPNGEDDE